MMRIPAVLVALSAAAACMGQAPASTQGTRSSTSVECAPMGKIYTRTTLYFGLMYPSGMVSEREWRSFLREQVTPRFPEGLTAWEAAGQWRRSDGSVARERAKVLLLVHEDKPEVRDAIATIIATYKRLFHQESVLWETAPVCAAF